ncbi:acyl carrier protein [Gloeobacter morelensis]|uniref:Carrier domain-containing protein n=1 Tax=Gloeobacter morelensis MG652769 TaxID=2781736 RepID=A0ABY3PR22_9CYAN|nr:hypothetical protein [Gloeobacter morelensis]UFP96163.1 hypothetical protein ISF26_08135 [Gloeobacter morelensis MG652769]
MNLNSIAHVLDQMHISFAELTVYSKLKADVGMDSLELIDFECFFEELFDVRLDWETMQADPSVQEVIDQALSKLSAGAVQTRCCHSALAA